MKSKSFIIVTAFIMLVGCFVLMAQDPPVAKTGNQTIGDLEQKVTDLQNEIQFLKTGSTELITDDNIAAPRPEFDSANGPDLNAPMPTSVYSLQPPTQPRSPVANAAPNYGYNYNPPMPRRPWAVVPPTHVVPTPVGQFVPVQVPVYIETTPCYFEYGPICDPYFPPAIGLEFWFGGGGNCNHRKHKH